MMLDCEELEDDTVLYVGRVMGADDESVLFRYVDPPGVWDEEAERIPYQSITSVRFGDRYSTVLARYVNPFPR